MDNRNTVMLEMLARKHNCSIEEIREQISTRIQAGIDDPDPASREQWLQIPRAGEIPTPEEFISYVSEKLAAEGLDHLLRWYPEL